MTQKYGKNEVYALLEERQVPYEKMEHAAVFTMEEMNQAGITEKGAVCKNLFLRDAKGKNHYLVTAPEEVKIDMKELAQKIGSTRLSFGSAERLMKNLGVEQGSVSPFGVLNNEDNGVVVVFDKSLEGGTIGLHPNDNTATIWMKFEDLRKLIKEVAGNKTMVVKL